MPKYSSCAARALRLRLPHWVLVQGIAWALCSPCQATRNCGGDNNNRPEEGGVASRGACARGMHLLRSWGGGPAPRSEHVARLIVAYSCAQGRRDGVHNDVFQTHCALRPRGRRRLAFSSGDDPPQTRVASTRNRKMP